MNTDKSYRKLQPSGISSLALNLPKWYVETHHLGIGSYVKCTIVSDGKRLIVEPVEEEVKEKVAARPESAATAAPALRRRLPPEKQQHQNDVVASSSQGGV
jgi:antitoxin component of MazEF toxin-antitoxin module